MVIEVYKRLPDIRRKYFDRKIALCCGNFDLTHAGHTTFLEHAKSLADILVVGVASDYIDRINKGSDRPVIPEAARLKMVDSLKPVDFTVLDNVSTEEEPRKFCHVATRLLRPNFYVVNHDVKDIDFFHDFCREYGVKIDVFQNTQFTYITTTSIIRKIRDSH